MEQTLILEIRGKDGSLKERRKLQGLPLTLGRSFSNDIIIDDPYICATHLRIEHVEGTGPVLQDVSLVNGVHSLPSDKKISTITLSPGIALRAGQTTLRIFSLDHQVEQTKVQRSQKRVLFGLARPGVALAFFLLLLAFQVLTSYAASYQKERHHGLLYLLLYAVAFDLALILPWAGLWTMVSRIVVHHAHFFAHVVASTIGLLTLEVLLSCAKFLTFAINASWAPALCIYLPAITVVSIQLTNHAKLATRVSVRRSALLATTVTVLLFGIYGAFRYAETTKYNANLPLKETLKPPAFDWAKAITVDEFVAETDPMEQELQTLAKDEE